jgi:RHS repeat-associated protein
LETERTTVNISDDKKKIATAETLTIDQGSLTVNPVAVIRYQLDNHLGSASLELDETADIISYEEYHPFGTTSYRSGRTETETSQKRYKYVGKERDEETGLYYYGFRYYAAWLCRFVSVDPLQFEYPYYTPFQYAGNKPINSIDLDGLEANNVVQEEEIGQQRKLLDDNDLLEANKFITENYKGNNTDITNELRQFGYDYLSERYENDLETFGDLENLVNEFTNTGMQLWTDKALVSTLYPELDQVYDDLIEESETTEEKLDLLVMRSDDASKAYKEIGGYKTVGFALEVFAMIATPSGRVAKPRTARRSFRPPIGLTVKSKIHKNSNSYVGHQGVYEIKINGKLHKYGKADMTSINKKTGLPTRLHNQLRVLKRTNQGKRITGKVLHENSRISTTNIKKIETKYIQNYYDKFKKYPPGNLNHPGIIK